MNNGGSRVLHQLINTSISTSCHQDSNGNLLQGQNLFGKFGFDHHKSNNPFFMFDERCFNSSNYNWPEIINQWNKNWQDKPIKVLGDPTNHCRLNKLNKLFPSAYWIFMSRNPYGQIESASRSGKTDDWDKLCAHWLAMKTAQNDFSSIIPIERKLSIQYQDLMMLPQKISTILPELSDIDIHAKFSHTRHIHQNQTLLSNFDQENKDRLPQKGKEAIERLLYDYI